MDIFFYILISTFSISLIAFVGAVILFLKEKLLDRILLILVSFAAGALIGGAFLHLIPEAIEEAGSESSLLKVFFYLLFGFCSFFVLENFISWHHHHSKNHPEIKSFSYLILISDSVHNFIDGLIIAASFIVSVPLGLATALAVALHEIPQEIGDFGILIYSGFKKAKALFLNFLSAFVIVFGGIFGFLLSEKISSSVVFLLPFAAGSFIYVACSDLIPEIKHKGSLQKALINFFVFLLGIGIMFLMKLL
ncbi:MAG: ZIP family metal transporter [Candidatus Nealsonbacteria bacterium]|nr:ZIP family metal transporter [Candidatus Nealsonbacteria bacterium]